MSRDELLEIWALPERELRRIAVREATSHVPESLGVCLDMLCASPPEQVAELLSPLCARLPFLKVGHSPASGHPDGTYQVFGEWAQTYHALMHLLETEQDTSWIQACYRYFDGLRPDLRQRFPDIDFADCLRPDERGQHMDHQLMVFVTGACNLRCPYCFSSDIEHTFISEHDLRRIFAWAAKNGCSMVTPCGGEPLMYPHIQLFMDLVADYGMTTYMASNCTFPLSRLAPKQLERIKVLTCHMTDALWQRPDYMQTFCENLDVARQYGMEVVARPNIIRPDVDINPWFELIDRHDLKTMYIALTIPSGAHDNLYIDAKVFADYAPIIRECIRRCQERYIRIGFAKPIPPCIFEPDMAAWLLQYDNFAPLCNNHEDNYTRNICLSPDLHFEACPGVPSPRIAFDESLTWEELAAHFAPRIESLLRRPLFRRCEHCILHARRLCQGACLSYKNTAPTS